MKATIVFEGKEYQYEGMRRVEHGEIFLAHWNREALLNDGGRTWDNYPVFAPKRPTGVEGTEVIIGGVRWVKEVAWRVPGEGEWVLNGDRPMLIGGHWEGGEAQIVRPTGIGRKEC